MTLVLKMNRGYFPKINTSVHSEPPSFPKTLFPSQTPKKIKSPRPPLLSLSNSPSDIKSLVPPQARLRPAARALFAGTDIARAVMGTTTGFSRTSVPSRAIASSDWRASGARWRRLGFGSTVVVEGEWSVWVLRSRSGDGGAHVRILSCFQEEMMVQENPIELEKTMA